MLNPDFRDLLSAFSAEGVEFLVVGAYALAAHGVPRATGDLDCWIRPSDDNAHRVLRALARFGAPAVVANASELAAPDLVVQLGVAPRRIDLMTSVDGVAFSDAWPRRALHTVDGVELPLLSREDLILNKRAVGRPRDLADLAALAEQEGGEGRRVKG